MTLYCTLPSSVLGLKLEDGRCGFPSVPLGKRRETKESMLVFTGFVPSVTLLFLQVPTSEPVAVPQQEDMARIWIKGQGILVLHGDSPCEVSSSS